MTGVMLSRDDVPICVPPRASPLVRSGKSIHALVGNIRALYKTNSFQLGEVRKPHNRLVSQVRAAAQVDITDPIARLDKTLHRVIREMQTMSQMNIVEVLAQTRNGINGGICDITTLCQYEIPQTWRSINDLFDSSVCQS